MKSYFFYQTDRLYIRPTFIDDYEFIYELMNTPKWLKYIGDRGIKSTEDAKQYIKNVTLAQLERLGYSNFTITRKSDQKKIGCCGLYDRKGVDGIDFGFAFLPEFERKGYAHEASKEIIKHVKNDYNINELKAITLPNNIPSQELLRKLGFKHKTNVRVNEKDVKLFIKLL